MKKWLFSLLMLMILSITACAVQIPPLSTYVLTVPTASVKMQIPRTDDVLLVSAMIANPGYKTAGMIYMTAPGYLHEYARHAWVAAPAQMLTPLIAERIESKQYFRAVVTPSFAGKADYRLDTHLVVLQQEFMQPVSQLSCVVQALLIDNKTGHVLASRRFQAVVSAPGNNPQSGVLAANQAVAQISEELAQFVISTVSASESESLDESSRNIS